MKTFGEQTFGPSTNKTLVISFSAHFRCRNDIHIRKHEIKSEFTNLWLEDDFDINRLVIAPKSEMIQFNAITSPSIWLRYSSGFVDRRTAHLPLGCSPGVEHLDTGAELWSRGRISKKVDPS
jgi:hypothetical protein